MKDVLESSTIWIRRASPETAAPGLEQSAGDWRPLSDVNGRYGTTDETHVLTRKRKSTCRLVDASAGQLVATARKSCPLDAAPDQ
jgi:hypothetical protein